MFEPLKERALFMIEREELFRSVRHCLAESLARPLEEIQLHSSLLKDLEAGSLDLIDIIFTLESLFQVKLKESEIDQLIRADFTKNLTPEGFLAPQDVQQLAQWMPLLQAEPDFTKIAPNTVFSYMTVESILLILERRLQFAQES